MKTIEKVACNAQFGRAEAEVATQIKALFGRCPELAGFAVQDLALSPECESIDEEQPSLFVTDVGLSSFVSPEHLDDVYTLIGTVISDVLSERPEAIEVLRGRTFARTLH